MVMKTDRTSGRRPGVEARREALLRAAERLLEANGAARVEDIVREAGVAKGTFYLYFPAFDDLLDVIRTRIFSAFDAAHPFEPPQRVGEWLPHLEALAVAFVHESVRLGALHDAVFHSDFAARRPIPDEIHPVNRLAAILAAGVAKRAFREVDVVPTARLLFAAMHETADAVRDGAEEAGMLSALRGLLRAVLSRRAWSPHPASRAKVAP